jgi:hypothetical protein
MKFFATGQALPICTHIHICIHTYTYLYIFLSLHLHARRNEGKKHRGKEKKEGTNVRTTLHARSPSMPSSSSCFVSAFSQFSPPGSLRIVRSVLSMSRKTSASLILSMSRIEEKSEVSIIAQDIVDRRRWRVWREESGEKKLATPGWVFEQRKYLRP